MRWLWISNAVHEVIAENQLTNQDYGHELC